MRYEVTVEVHATPERVWEVLVDVERWPTWSPTMTRVDRLEDTPFAVGSTARIRQPRLRPATWRVTDLVARERFTWETAMPGVRLAAEHDVVPGPGEHTSSVTLRIAMDGPLASLLGLLAGRMVRGYVDQEAAGLKRRVES